MTSKTTLTALTLAAILGVAAYTALPAGAQDGSMGMGGGMGMHMGPNGGSGMPAFETIDADKDGKITPAELSATRKAAVTGTDSNADGKLSAEELTAQQVRMMTERAAAQSARMILVLDVDGDGLLSVEEMAAGPGPMRMFDRMDADGDGAITKAEADAAAERMQDRQGGEGRGHRGKGGRHHGDGQRGGQGPDGAMGMNDAPEAPAEGNGDSN